MSQFRSRHDAQSNARQGGSTAFQAPQPAHAMTLASPRSSTKMAERPQPGHRAGTPTGDDHRVEHHRQSSVPFPARHEWQVNPLPVDVFIAPQWTQASGADIASRIRQWIPPECGDLSGKSLVTATD